jgi:predicted ATPase/transcriptional regulator with XRE-family HTH domain
MPDKNKKLMAHELLQMYRHRTGLTQTGLAAELDKSSKRMVQYWEAGTSLPKQDSLRRLLALLVARKIFHPGQEKLEAARLWTAIKEASDTRLDLLSPYPIFDEGWFEDLLDGRIATFPSKTNLAEQPESQAGSATGKEKFFPGEDFSNNNLPVQLTSFIGREREIELIKRLLEKTHLLTLTGTGGAGKTRLALEVAGELLGNFEDGVWLVELAPLINPELVSQSVGMALGLKETTGNSQLNGLIDYLKDKKALLVLDNCEHLLEASGSLASDLLKRCPRLKILATSREGLNIGGEVEWSVPPLSMPDQATLKQGLNLADLTTYESTRLFLNRAEAARPDFKLTSETGLVLADICLRLDGIPLALELAAARVKVLSLEQINARLAERFKLLTGGRRALIPRHRTLTTLIDWSYNLLGEAEQRLLDRVSVFRDGCNLEAVEQVCQGAGVEETAILDLLSSLVNKSLVLAEEKSGEIRYRLLETIQEYARLKLEERQETQQFEQQASRYFLNMVTDLLPLIKDREFAALIKLDREYGNIRVLLDRTIQTGETEKALELCSALGSYWYIKGYYQDGLRYLERSLALPGGTPTPVRSQACTWRSGLAFITGNNEVALNSVNLGLEIARQLNYTPGILDNLYVLGTHNFRCNNFKEAILCLQECLDLAYQAQDKPRITSLLNTLGQVFVFKGDYSKARDYAWKALTLAKDRGDKMELTISLNTLGVAECYSGAYQEAASFLEQAKAIGQACGFNIGIHETLEQLGRLAIYQGDYEIGETYLNEAVRMSRTQGNPRGLMTEYCLWGLLAGCKGECQTARHYLREAISISQEIKSPYTELIGQGILGWIALKEDHLEEAAQLLRQSMELCRQIDSRGQVVEALAVLIAVWQRLGAGKLETVRLAGGVERVQLDTGHRMQPANRQVYKEALSALSTSLSPSEYAAAWEQGLQMDWEEITSFALKNKGLT